jgi:hypothetical protein
MIESPRKTHDTTMMVNGSPSGVKILASGSKSVFHISVVLNSRWRNIRPEKSKVAIHRGGRTPYSEINLDGTIPIRRLWEALVM